MSVGWMVSGPNRLVRVDGLCFVNSVVTGVTIKWSRPEGVFSESELHAVARIFLRRDATKAEIAEARQAGFQRRVFRTKAPDSRNMWALTYVVDAAVPVRYQHACSPSP